MTSWFETPSFDKLRTAPHHEVKNKLLTLRSAVAARLEG